MSGDGDRDDRGRPAGLPPLVGHRELRERLAGAVRRGRLPSSLLFHGPPGVGKQRLALWLAALLQCGGTGADAAGDGEPCGECRSCRLARRLEHPDIHWFFPLPRPKGAGSREKLREKLEEARMEALERRRREPLAPVRGEGSTGIYLAAVQEMRERASRRPAMGPRSIYVVGEAEAMVPQAANPEAANAFLKLLEEPPEDTYVVLTSSRPGALLPTIRSRVLSLPVSPLSDRAAIRDFLTEHAGVDRDEAERAARLSRGSVGRALAQLSPEERELRERAAELLGRAVKGDPGDRLEGATRFGASGARGEFSDLLAAAAEILRDVASVVEGQEERAFDPALARRVLDGRTVRTEGILDAQGAVAEARRLARRNVNPQAIVAVLLEELADALQPT